MNPIAELHAAIWECIKSYPVLQQSFDQSGVSASGDSTSIFTTMFKLNSNLDTNEAKFDITPSVSDLPAIKVSMENVPIEWVLNRGAELSPVFTITLWHEGWEYETPTEHALRVIEAIWQATSAQYPSGIVKQVTGHYPKQTGPISCGPVKLGKDGKLKAMETRITFVFRIRRDLLGTVRS